jgi:hypothetical protein
MILNCTIKIKALNKVHTKFLPKLIGITYMRLISLIKLIYKYGILQIEINYG